MRISRTNVASVGNAFNYTRKVKVLSLPETIKEKSTFRAKALRRELVLLPTSTTLLTPDEEPFSFIVSGSERTFTFRVPKNANTVLLFIRDTIMSQNLLDKIGFSTLCEKSENLWRMLKSGKGLPWLPKTLWIALLLLVSLLVAKQISKP